MTRPPEMIKCGWEECGSWFSTGIDMNQHVLLNHIKFMKVKFVEADTATAEPKKKPETRQTTPQHPARQPSVSSSQPIQPHPSNLHQFHHQMMLHNSFAPPHLIRPSAPPPPPQVTSSGRDYLGDSDVLNEEKPPVFLSGTNQKPPTPIVYDIDDEDDEEVDAESLDDGVGETPAKKARKKPGSGTPWAQANHASSAPDPMIRLTSPYLTIGLMAEAIFHELTSRKTLRKRNRFRPGLPYCVICLDYLKDNGMCDFPHNNQQTHFIQYWQTMYGSEEPVKKSILLQQFSEMQRLPDLLPPLSTVMVP